MLATPDRDVAGNGASASLSEVLRVVEERRKGSAPQRK
jgi:hypothetical protein